MPVRTTLTLDDDVASALRRESARTGRPLRSVANDALRTGRDRRTRKRGPFTVLARDLGIRPEVDLDDVEGLLDRVEGHDRR